MGRYTVPLKEILVCDKCSYESEYKEGSKFYLGKLTLHGVSSVGNYLGDGGAGYDVSYDFCVDCEKEFYKWLRK